MGRKEKCSGCIIIAEEKKRMFDFFQGNSLRVLLVRPRGVHSGAGFRATYSVEDAACGGEITAGEGRFASPAYPDSYPNSAQCVWSVGGAPGNRVSLSFLTFDLQVLQIDDCTNLKVETSSLRCRIFTSFFCENNRSLSVATATTSRSIQVPPRARWWGTTAGPQFQATSQSARSSG